MKKIAMFALISTASLSLVACQPIEDFKRGYEQGMQEAMEQKKIEEADKIVAEEAEKLGEELMKDMGESSESTLSEENSVEQELIDVMYESLAVLQGEDVYSYMDYFALTPENYEYNLQFNLALAEMYDISYVIEDVEVLEVTPTTAKVKVVQSTTKIDGPDDFTDNRSTFIHNMVLDDLQWKFESSEVLSSETL